MTNRKNKSLSAGRLDAVARLFFVLSEPSRLALLQLLHAGPLTVNELVEANSMKQANVSKQLAILHDSHLVKREREGTSIRYEIADPMVFSRQSGQRQDGQGCQACRGRVSPGNLNRQAVMPVCPLHDQW